MNARGSIGFDATSLESSTPAGVGRYTAQLLAALLQQPGAPRIALLAGRPLSAAVTAGTLGQVGPQFPNRTIWMQTVLPRALRRMSLRLCHFTNALTPLRSSIPYIVTVHDMAVYRFADTQPLRHRLAASVLPRAARRAAIVVTVSNAARQDIIDVLKLPPDRVRVVYSAAAPEFRPLEAVRESDQQRVQARYQLAAPFVLHVGTIEPRKNLSRLIEAYARLRRQGHREELLLVGQRGWKDAEVFATIARERVEASVRVIGYVEAQDLPVIYALARVIAQPSRYEGFCLPILEGMAAGIPVLTSQRPAMAEVAGGAAVLVDPDRSDSIEEGLRQLLEDGGLRADLRRRGFERAAQFSWTRAASQMLEIYEAVGA